jgi:hypothetical protein
MDTGGFLVVDCLVAKDANRVLFGLDLEVVLADAGQFHNHNEVVALLENIHRWIAANARRAFAHPIAFKAGIERPLEGEQCLEWIAIIGHHGPPLEGLRHPECGGRARWGSVPERRPVAD